MRLFLIVLVMCIPAAAFAAHRCPSVAVAHQQQVLLAIPYAIPVGVPSYVQYQAMPAVQPQVCPQPAPQPAPTPGPEPMVDPLAPEAKAPAGSWAKQLTAKSLRTANCVSCHSGDTAKGGLDLTGDIDCETKLKCIQRMLADDPSKQMPKGKPISDQTRGLLIQEFAK